MSVYHVIEFLIVGGAVGISGWNLAKRFLPQRGAAKSDGCSACDSCSGCGTSTPPAARDTERPVQFHR